MLIRRGLPLAVLLIAIVAPTPALAAPIAAPDCSSTARCTQEVTVSSNIANGTDSHADNGGWAYAGTIRLNPAHSRSRSQQSVTTVEQNDRAAAQHVTISASGTNTSSSTSANTGEASDGGLIATGDTDSEATSAQTVVPRQSTLHSAGATPLSPH
jgi:hypothetical protein